MDGSIDRKNLIVMKLLHYFITEKNYNPIILQGADDEIWLENLDGDYKIVRIVSNHIHNDEQLNFDMFKTRHIVKKIKRKTFSFSMNVLSIFTDVDDDVKLEDKDGIDCISLYDENDINRYNFLYNYFPDIDKKLKFNEEGLQLFMKITSDINKTNKTNAQQAEEVFKKKEPIVTYILLGINIFVFILMFLFGQRDYFINKFAVYGPLVTRGEYYRLLTGTFLHADLIHILFNSYALYIIGSQIESFMGKFKFLIIYLGSAIIGSLFSITFSNVASIGASGAIFGLMGSLVYFGYHYRVYLGNALKSQIIPLIILNLLIGLFSGGTIDNYAHIGGLIGGVLLTISLGVKYKSSKFEMINGWIVTIILLVFLYLLSFNLIG